jgi:hypothetical protein
LEERAQTRFPWQGGKRIGDNNPSAQEPSPKMAVVSKCQFHVYFLLLTSVCLSSLSLHRIKETDVRYKIKLEPRCVGIWRPLRELVVRDTFASRSTLKWVRKPQLPREGDQGYKERDRQRGQDLDFLLGHHATDPQDIAQRFPP